MFASEALAIGIKALEEHPTLASTIALSGLLGATIGITGAVYCYCTVPKVRKFISQACCCTLWKKAPHNDIRITTEALPLVFKDPQRLGDYYYRL